MAYPNANIYYRLPLLDGLELLDARHHTVSFPAHTHPTFNIALVLNETFRIQLPDKLLRSPVGTLSITNPQEVHATPCEDHVGNTFFTFYVSPDVLKKLNQDRAVFFASRTVYDPALFNEFFLLVTYFGRLGAALESRIIRALEQLVIRHATEEGFRPATLQLFQDFIEEDTLEKRSLEEHARRFGLNKYKFIRLFRQETGLTPQHFVLLKRIEASKKLLAEGYDTLEAAVRSGFYDTAHLYRHFVRFTGVTPLTYQQAFQEG